MNNLSLLDWIKSKLSRLGFKRWLRLGLALVAGLWGGLALFVSEGRDAALGYLLIGLAFGLFVWGLWARAAATAPAELPELAFGQKLQVGLPRVGTVWLKQSVVPLMGLGGLLCVVLGQWALSRSPGYPPSAVFFLALGVVWGVVASWRLGADLARPALPAAVAEPSALSSVQRALTARWPLVLGALVLSGITFLATGDNTFTLFGFCVWLASLAAWLWAFWEGRFWRWPNWQAWKERFERGAWHFSLTRTHMLLGAILLVSIGFRYYQLNSVPGEMTSDHVEKLLDVNDIIFGRRPIFEPGNGGREPLMFYLSALTAVWAGTGLTHLTLKLVAATVGVLTLPFIFLLAREITDDDGWALLTTLAAGLGWWPNVISRNGLRFPFAMFFAALVLWLLVRALKRRQRNAVLLSGLFLGLGMYGYTPNRILPLAVLAAVVVYVAHDWRSTAKRAGVWLAMAALVAIGGVVPLWRYSVDEPDNFWRRTTTRILGDEGQTPATVKTFLTNSVNAALMFSKKADNAWLVSPPGQPALDYVMGGLFVLGLAVLIYRYVRWRHWLDLLPLVILPLLLLPSILALAFPIENPSLHRASMAIPIVFLIVALPLRLLVDFGRRMFSGGRGTVAGAGLAVVVLAFSASVNAHILFVDYVQSYRQSALNASEIGQVIHDFASTIGSYDTVFVRPYPYWVDTRAVGMYAQGGQIRRDFGREFAIQYADLGRLQNDPRPRLFILHRLDYRDRPDGEQPSLPQLRLLYPDGKLSLYTSKIPGQDFLLYFVPGTQDLDASQLPKQ